MGNFSPAMLTEVRRSNPRLRYGLSFDFPDGVERFSDVAWCPRGGGYHAPLIKSWGQIRDAVSDRRNNLEVSKLSGVEIFDQRNRWKQREEKYELRGTPVTLLYGADESRRILSADWLTRISGVLLDWKVQDGVITIEDVGPPFILALRSHVPHLFHSVSDHIDLPDEAVGLASAMGPYSRHDSFAFGNLVKGDNDGQVSPLYVGEYEEINKKGNLVAGSKFLLGPGRVKRVWNVYVNEVKTPKDDSWGDQEIYEEINGVTWSRIMFKSNKSTATITLDVDGYETVGDGTGTLIEDPMDILLHWLSNFVFAKYRTGLWLPTHPLAHATLALLMSGYLGKQRIPMAYKNARYIEAAQDRKPAIDYLNDWTVTNEAKSFATLDGKLAFGADSFDDPGYDAVHVRRAYHELITGLMKPERGSVGAARRVAGETSYSHHMGTFTERLSVLSQINIDESTDSISCHWGPGHL